MVLWGAPYISHALASDAEGSEKHGAEMKYLAIALTIFTTSAFAADQINQAFVTRAVAALQNQRNIALDAQANCEARSGSLEDAMRAMSAELDAAKAKIKELEKTEPKEP